MKFLFALFTLSILFSFETIGSTVSDTISIPEIKVTAGSMEGELKTISGSISVLTASQLEKQDQLTISQQLNALPGVFMHSGTFNTNRIVIRGIGSRTPYSSNRIRAYLNDIPLTNGDGVTTLEDIDISGLGRIEVMKGPNSALYGSGLGGTIKLQTNVLGNEFKAGRQMGSFGTNLSKLQGGFQQKGKSVSASLHHMHSDGYRENNEYDRISGIITGGVALKKSLLSFTALYANMLAQIPSSIDEETFLNSRQKAAANWQAAKGFENSERLLLGATLNSVLNEYYSNKFVVFGGFSNAFEHRPFNDLKDNSITFGIRDQFHFHSEKLDAVAGFEVFNEWYNWQTEKEEKVLNAISERRSYVNLSGLLNYRVLEKLNFSFAVNLNRLNYRYESESGTEDEFSYPIIFSPRAGFNYALNSRLNFYSSIGHGFSAPSLEETLLPNGDKNPDLKPEQGIMSEVGLRFSTFDKKLFIDATLYHIALNDLLLTKRLSEENFLGVNAGKTSHAGIELQLHYELVEMKTFPGNVSLSSSVSLSQNRFIDFLDDGVDMSGNRLPGIPAQTIFTGLTWKPQDKIGLNLNYQFFGKQYLNDSNSKDYEPESVLNLNGSYLFSNFKKVDFYIKGGINNLFNRDYASMILVNAPSFGGSAPRYYYPGLPRNYYFSIAIHF